MTTFYERTYDKVITLTSQGAGTVILDRLNKDVFRSARYVITWEANTTNEVMCTELLVVHDSTSANLVEFGAVSPTDLLMDISISTNASEVILECTIPGGITDSNITIRREAMKVINTGLIG